MQTQHIIHTITSNSNVQVRVRRCHIIFVQQKDADSSYFNATHHTNAAWCIDNSLLSAKSTYLGEYTVVFINILFKSISCSMPSSTQHLRKANGRRWRDIHDATNKILRLKHQGCFDVKSSSSEKNSVV